MSNGDKKTKDVAPADPVTAPSNSDSKAKAVASAEEKSRLEKVATRTNIFIALLTGSAGLVGAILGAVFAVFVWVDAKVDNRVKDIIEPYESYLTGVNLIRDEYYDRAVPEFEKSFEGLLKRGTAKERVVPVADSYLRAIVNTDNPAHYTANFRKVRDYLDREAPTTAWYFNEYGWYYFRMNNLPEARNNFNQAIAFYKAEGLDRSMAVSSWGLALVNLSEGKVDEAVEQTKQAAGASPLEYGLKNILLERDAIRKQKWNVQAMRMYVPFERSMDLFFDRLNEELKTQEERVDRE